MLMRFDPFRDFDRLTQQAFGAGAQRAAMPLDAYRHDDRFVVHFDLPGVDPSSIDLSIEKNVLTVSAERHWDTEGQGFIASERPQGTFSRQLFQGTVVLDHGRANKSVRPSGVQKKADESDMQATHCSGIG